MLNREIGGSIGWIETRTTLKGGDGLRRSVRLRVQSVASIAAGERVPRDVEDIQREPSRGALESPHHHTPQRGVPICRFTPCAIRRHQWGSQAWRRSARFLASTWLRWGMSPSESPLRAHPGGICFSSKSPRRPASATRSRPRAASVEEALAQAAPRDRDPGETT
jgi:hypothetical protein